jgi:transcriptional regulator with XRE-family HTH domain
MAEPKRQASLNNPAKKNPRGLSGDPVIGARLASAMKASPIKAAVLAKELGVSKSAVSQWIKGQTAIDPKHIPTISTLVHLPMSELYALPDGAEFLTAQERQLLDVFRNRLDDEQRESLLVILRSR